MLHPRRKERFGKMSDISCHAWNHFNSLVFNVLQMYVLDSEELFDFPVLMV